MPYISRHCEFIKLTIKNVIWWDDNPDNLFVSFPVTSASNFEYVYDCKSTNQTKNLKLVFGAVENSKPSSPGICKNAFVMIRLVYRMEESTV